MSLRIGRRRLARPVGVVALVALMALLTGCAAGDALVAPDLESHVEVDSPALRSAKKEIGVRPCPAEGDGTSRLPELTLPCLGGGPSVRLSDVAGPAVISLWASWCSSCPDELPLFQRLSEAAGDGLTVLGVDYQDTQPGGALTLLQQAGATFPQLADPGGSLADEFRIVGLPGLLLVDGDGQVTFLLRRIDDYAELAGLVRDHTGVDVAAAPRALGSAS